MAESLICTICARAGSKGVKNKNLRQLLDLPLIAHTIRQAQKTKIFDTIAVSSDSEEILQTALEHGATQTILRPIEMATDTAAKLPAIRHCLQEAEKKLNKKFDVVVDLDCTSPLRLPEDIIGAVEMLKKRDAQNILTGQPAHRSPYFNLVELQSDHTVKLSKSLDNAMNKQQIVRRQDAPKCFDLNASIYVWRRNVLIENDNLFLPKTFLYEMPSERSLDIDSELDFEVVEFLAKKRGFLS